MKWKTVFFLFLSPASPIKVTHNDVTVLVVFKAGVKVQGHQVLVMSNIYGEAVDRQTDRQLDNLITWHTTRVTVELWHVIC